MTVLLSVPRAVVSRSALHVRPPRERGGAVETPETSANVKDFGLESQSRRGSARPRSRYRDAFLDEFR